MRFTWDVNMHSTHQFSPPTFFRAIRGIHLVQYRDVLIYSFNQYISISDVKAQNHKNARKNDFGLRAWGSSSHPGRSRCLKQRLRYGVVSPSRCTVSRFGEKTGGGVLPIKPWTRAKFGIPFLRFSLHVENTPSCLPGIF